MPTYHFIYIYISQAASVGGARRDPSALPSAAVGREHPQKKEKEKEKGSTHLRSSSTNKYGNDKENNAAVALATHTVAGAVAGAVAASPPHLAPASVSAFLGEKKKENENGKKEKSPGGVRTLANAHASPLQAEAEKKEKKEKGLGLLRLQNLWDDDEAEAFFFFEKHLCFCIFFFSHTTLCICRHTSYYSICVVIPDTTLHVCP